MAFITTALCMGAKCSIVVNGLLCLQVKKTEGEETLSM